MRYLLFNKPYEVPSQFTDEGTGHPTLKQYLDVPNIYAAGHLDRESEGLLLLTDDGSLIKRFTDPKHHVEAWKWGVVLVDSLGSGTLNEHQRATVQVLWKMYPPLELF